MSQCGYLMWFPRYYLNNQMRGSAQFWERERRESECPFLPLPVDALLWIRIGGGRSSLENTVCSCKQMAGNYLQFGIYTLVPPFSPSTRRLSFSWLFSALSFHPGAIHRLLGNCQRSAPRNAGVAGQQWGPRAPRKCVNLCIFAKRDNRGWCRNLAAGQGAKYQRWYKHGRLY